MGIAPSGKRVHFIPPIKYIFNYEYFSKVESCYLIQKPSYQYTNTKWQINCVCSQKISCCNETYLGNRIKSNDYYLLNYGRYPIINIWDEIIIFEDKKSLSYWWIISFGKEQSQTKRFKIIQSIESAISIIEKEMQKLEKSNKTFDIWNKKQFKILSSSTIDARIKIAFARAWMLVDPNINELNAVRLAEISIAIRASQVLSLFSTSLLNDLNFLTKKINYSSLLYSERKYFKRVIKRYENEMRIKSTLLCSIKDLYELSRLLTNHENIWNSENKEKISTTNLTSHHDLPLF